ncbi:hypothetical protein, variant [Aphanomyces invadans]|uniref:Methyltransferase small domain-containing protein n=1 Tax=Aphanomyces invadans TaxID=157072 RepID=A0A024UT13_9STRA|nr:hypothetical protein, variant [Aphanomyces invadans]ETW09661.1 hypothetical protein, variant [Aphanomyces invadans]|eukprot:XP_008861072.1 hypothetical protein, variant [Aphanomyces invadans]
MEAVKSTVTVFEFGTVRVLVQEELGHVEDDNVDGLGIGWYVWPSAIKLATFIHHNQHLVAGKRVLELGAGTALPGLLAAKLGAAHVMLTDKDEVALRNARGAIKLNGIAPTTITLVTDLCKRMRLSDNRRLDATGMGTRLWWRACRCDPGCRLLLRSQ